jgi:hypothetical protein
VVLTEGQRHHGRGCAQHIISHGYFVEQPRGIEENSKGAQLWDGSRGAMEVAVAAWCCAARCWLLIGKQGNENQLEMRHRGRRIHPLSRASAMGDGGLTCSSLDQRVCRTMAGTEGRTGAVHRDGWRAR